MKWCWTRIVNTTNKIVILSLQIIICQNLSTIVSNLTFISTPILNLRSILPLLNLTRLTVPLAAGDPAMPPGSHRTLTALTLLLTKLYLRYLQIIKCILPAISNFNSLIIIDTWFIRMTQKIPFDGTGRANSINLCLIDLCNWWLSLVEAVDIRLAVLFCWQVLLDLDFILDQMLLPVWLDF